MSYYLGAHRSQYDGSALARQNCAPTTLANALHSTMMGAINLTGGQVRAKVANAEETNPATPGWSLEDMRLAASRIAGAPALVIRTAAWTEVERLRALGFYVLLPGDSDRFPDGTCSGAFDGNHMAGLHPNGAITLGDPICPSWRTETPATIRAYAEKLGGATFRFATLAIPVPLMEANMRSVTTLVGLAAPNPRRFTIPPNTTVNGYDPAQPGVVVRTFKTGALASSASADATASVAWYDTATPPAPRGSGFLRVAPGIPGGVLAGLLIVASLVTLDPAAGDTSPYTQAQLDAAVKAATDPLNARIAGIKAKTATFAADVAND